MSTGFKLSILDIGRVAPEDRHQDSIWNTIELAQRVDEFGYHRFWIAEHHGRDVAHSSPELLVPVIAGVTRNLRVGPAGVLLRFYSPFKVAKDFRTLHTVFPRRIDLGVARGFVAEKYLPLLNEGRPEIPFEDKVGDLMGYLRGTGPAVANPSRTPVPEAWMLGTTTTSMRLAAKHGTCFSLAAHLNEKGASSAQSIIGEFRSTYQPSTDHPAPQWSISLAGVCARSKSEAESIMQPWERLGEFPSVVGTPDEWRTLFERLRDETGTTEFVILDVCKKAEDRVRSYEMLANAILK